jgi:release factor glutamine methyltransferase
MTGPSVGTALADARARGLDRLDAQLLLAFVVGQTRTWVLAHDDRRLDAAQATAWERLLARRAAGEPLAYLLGAKEFHGVSLEVDARVLVPRPETELLVEHGLALLASRAAATSEPARVAETPRVVDLGTGSGAIALALKAAHPAAHVHASDRSLDALSVARANAGRLGLEIDFRHGSWWTPWTGARFHLALANPPYIAVGDPHLAALGHEPATALVGGADGLAALRAIVADAPGHLEPGGWLWLEHGHDQAEAVRDLLRSAGFSAVATLSDLGAQPRCSGGRL